VTTASQLPRVEGQRQVVAGRPRTGVSAPTIVAAHREVLTAGPTVGGASEDSPVGGEAEVSKVTANGPLIIIS
jgi:hypothetical protein